MSLTYRLRMSSELPINHVTLSHVLFLIHPFSTRCYLDNACSRCRFSSHSQTAHFHPPLRQMFQLLEKVEMSESSFEVVASDEERSITSPSSFEFVQSDEDGRSETSSIRTNTKLAELTLDVTPQSSSSLQNESDISVTRTESHVRLHDSYVNRNEELQKAYDEKHASLRAARKRKEEYLPEYAKIADELAAIDDKLLENEIEWRVATGSSGRLAYVLPEFKKTSPPRSNTPPEKKYQYGSCFDEQPPAKRIATGHHFSAEYHHSVHSIRNHWWSNQFIGRKNHVQADRNELEVGYAEWSEPHFTASSRMYDSKLEMFNKSIASRMAQKDHQVAASVGTSANPLEECVETKASLKARVQELDEKFDEVGDPEKIEEAIQGEWRIVQAINVEPYMMAREACHRKNDIFRDANHHFSLHDGNLEMHQSYGGEKHFVMSTKLGERVTECGVVRMSFILDNALYTLDEGAESREDLGKEKRIVRDGKLHVVRVRNGISCKRIYEKVNHDKQDGDS